MAPYNGRQEKESEACYLFNAFLKSKEAHFPAVSLFLSVPLSLTRYVLRLQQLSVVFEVSAVPVCAYNSHLQDHVRNYYTT